MRGPDVPSQSPRTLEILAAKMGPAELDVIVASAYATSWASARRASANQPIRFRHDFARLRDDLTRHDDQLVHFGFRVSDPTPLHIDAVLRRIPVGAIEGNELGLRRSELGQQLAKMPKRGHPARTTQ